LLLSRKVNKFFKHGGKRVNSGKNGTTKDEPRVIRLIAMTWGKGDSKVFGGAQGSPKVGEGTYYFTEKQWCNLDNEEKWYCPTLGVTLGDQEGKKANTGSLGKGVHPTPRG